MSRRQTELVGKFKIAAGDMLSIIGQVMEYKYIPTDLVWIATGRCKSSGLLEEDR